MKASCHVGTSGWVYPHWEGVFYPADLPRDAWFSYYAERFSTVEINYTFYRLPDPNVFARWRRDAPAGFIYAVKANRYLTHIKRLKDCGDALPRFLDRARLLGPCLGPVLYQLPPRWAANVERLEEFAALLPDDLTHVFEFRDDRWFNDSVRDVLQRHGLGFCIHDMAGTDCPRWAIGPVTYVRFHGSASGEAGDYSSRELRKWADIVLSPDFGGRPVYAYFNNDAEGNAVRNAAAFGRLIAAHAEPPAVSRERADA